jgi:hypothetical protein
VSFGKRRRKEDLGREGRREGEGGEEEGEGGGGREDGGGREGDRKETREEKRVTGRRGRGVPVTSIARSLPSDISSRISMIDSIYQRLSLVLVPPLLHRSSSLLSPSSLYPSPYLLPRQQFPRPLPPPSLLIPPPLSTVQNSSSEGSLV